MQKKEIRWKTSFWLFSIYLCCFIFLTSCDNGKGPSIPEFQPDTSDITPGDISDRLVARIYFDATLSMQGFVVPGSTRYTQICRYLESVIVSGWENGSIDFFRFGEQVEPIDRNTYLNLSGTEFYENSRIFRETFIQKIIDHEAQLTHDEVEESTTTEESITIPEETNNNGRESPLVVIVTDLFQDNRDLTVLVTQLKQQYIQKDLEVGLLGIRSEFDGTVYDLGQEPLTYQNKPGKPETFRPFYLLVLGRHADIAHYFDRLIANGFSEAKTIIFSQYLVKQLLSFEEANITTENLHIRESISRAHNRNPRLKQFQIATDSVSAKISAKELEYVLLPHTMRFDNNLVEASIITKHNLTSETQISRKPEECLEMESTLNEGDSDLTVDFSLASDSLKSGIYLYEVTLSPGVDAFQIPEWCSEWDMGSARDGARTLNLRNFVQNLSQITVRTRKPKIAQFYCYIEKK